MAWEKMAERLAKGSPNLVEYREIIYQKEEFSRLIETLSKILKDREVSLFYNLQIIWLRSLDHIYVILNVINM